MLEIISIFISSLVLVIMFYVFIMIIIDNKPKISLNKTLIIILISSVLNTVIYQYSNETTKTILICLLYACILKYIFNLQFPKSIFTSIIFMAFTVIPDLITLGIVTKIFNISKEYCHTHIAGSIISNVLVSIITITLTYVLKKPLRKILNYNFSTNKKIIMVSALTLVSLTIFFYSLISTFRLNNNIIGYLIVIITLIVILFYLFKQKMDNDLILKKYDDLLNIMKNYESDIEEQRIIVHETRNELMTIKSKINDKEKENEIIKYIDSILGDKTSSEMSKYSKFKYLPSNGIKGFFYYKFTEAEKRDIKVSVNISKKIEDSFLGNLETKKFKDLVRMIGVYLDNAIEASVESKDKKIGIEIYPIKEHIEIIISNSFINEINTDKLGIEKFTTKGKNHGHGLLLVKHILNCNSIFEAKHEITNNLYVQKLIIKNAK